MSVCYRLAWCFIGLSAVATAAPVPRVLEPAVSIPTKVGTQWVYQDGKEERIREVVGRVESPEATVVTISEMDPVGKRAITEKLSASKEGLFLIERFELKIEKPICLLKLPCRAGETWEKKLPNNAVTKWTIGKQETVEVPAGRFEAVPVISEHTYSDGSKSRGVSWYANGVGLVKMVSNDDPPMVLKAFTLGTK